MSTIKYQIKGKVIDLMNKYKPDYSIGFWVKALYTRFNIYLYDNNKYNPKDQFKSIKDCSEENLKLLLDFMKDEDNIAKVKETWRNMNTQHERNISDWIESRRIRSREQKTEHESEKTEEEKRREYIQSKLFGGLGGDDDETQTWRQVLSSLDENPSWTPSSHFCGGLPSDNDDTEREAYNYLKDEYF